MDSPKIVISGATGWLGQELIKVLSTNELNRANMTLVSSKTSKFTIENKQYEAKNFANTNLRKEIDFFYDFAFLTRKKINNIGPQKYVDINTTIINNSFKLIKKCKPKSVILASSGAVYKAGKNHNIDNNYLYADLKNFQEEKIAEACSAVGANLVIARIFNISGSGINKVNNFAISDFIEKSISNKDIEIKSNYLVFRRYCDITQLLRLMEKLSEQPITITFDSGGFKIELRDLAQKIIMLLGSNSKVVSKEISNNMQTDNYFSASNKYELLLKKFLNEDSVTIEKQIKITSESLTNTIS